MGPLLAGGGSVKRTGDAGEAEQVGFVGWGTDKAGDASRSNTATAFANEGSWPDNILSVGCTGCPFSSQSMGLYLFGPAPNGSQPLRTIADM